MIQGLDSCWNSGVEVVRPRPVVLLEYQHLSASTDNFSVKQWEAVAIHAALKLVGAKQWDCCPCSLGVPPSFTGDSKFVKPVMWM
jgi:hypothetical protein